MVVSEQNEQEKIVGINSYIMIQLRIEEVIYLYMDK